MQKKIFDRLTFDDFKVLFPDLGKIVKLAPNTPEFDDKFKTFHDYRSERQLYFSYLKNQGIRCIADLSMADIFGPFQMLGKRIEKTTGNLTDYGLYKVAPQQYIEGDNDFRSIEYMNNFYERCMIATINALSQNGISFHPITGRDPQEIEDRHSCVNMGEGILFDDEMSVYNPFKGNRELPYSNKVLYDPKFPNRIKGHNRTEEDEKAAMQLLKTIKKSTTPQHIAIANKYLSTYFDKPTPKIKNIESAKEQLTDYFESTLHIS